MMPSRTCSTHPSRLFQLVAVLLLSPPLLVAQQAQRPEKGIGVVTDVPGALVFAEPRHAVFDDAYQHALVEHRFVVSNAGEAPVIIEDAVALKGEAGLEMERSTLAPGESTTITVRQRLGDALGRVAFRYALITDEPGVSRYRFSLSGFVQSAFDPERPTLDFGRVIQGQEARAQVELFSREVDRMQLERMPQGPAYLALQSERRGVEDEGLALLARLLPLAPLGLLWGELALETNVAHQPKLVVTFRAEVFGDVVPSQHPIAFGLVRSGVRVRKQLKLESRSGTPFRVVSVQDDAGLLDVSFSPCGTTSAPDTTCWSLELSTLIESPARFGGRLLVGVAGANEPVPLTYSGFVVAPGTRVETINLPAQAGGGGAADATPNR